MHAATATGLLHRFQVQTRLAYIPPYLVVTTSSLLIAFRTIAVWSYDMRVVSIVLVGWLAEFGLALFTIVAVRRTSNSNSVVR